MSLRQCFAILAVSTWSSALLAAQPVPPPVPPDLPPPPPGAEPPLAAPDASPPESAPAAAAATTPPPAASGKIQLHTEPPPPPVRRTDHVHDGFYLRLDGGIGSLAGTYDSDGAPADLDLDGFALGFDLLVGGSPAPGVAIGGGVLTNVAPSAQTEIDDIDLGNRSIGLALAGAFFDGFFNPRKGFHLGGMLGLARIDVEDDSESGDVAATGGLGGAAWIGYDFWVAEQWSTGILFRVAGAVTRNGDEDVDASAVATSVMFTALYH